jgi:hypothetical protein
MPSANTTTTTTTTTLTIDPALLALPHDTRPPAITVLASILFVLTAAILAIRVYSRRCISYGFALDDVLILAAMVPATAFAATAIVGEQALGWDGHVWDVQPHMWVPGLQMR